VAGETVAKLVAGFILCGVMLVVLMLALQETFDWLDGDDDGE
jgi:hypothetical protein